MKAIIVILVAVAALIGTAPASAQLIAHPRCSSLDCRMVSQKQNLAHAKYLCNRGRHIVKRWGCHAVKWLTKELNETKEAMRPRVAALSHYSGWMCIHAREGSWNAQTGNGYYGGLQMSYGWAGRVSNAALLSPDAQVAAAEAEAAEHRWDYGWMASQWPNTFPPCSGYF